MRLTRRAFAKSLSALLAIPAVSAGAAGNPQPEAGREEFDAMLLAMFQCGPHRRVICDEVLFRRLASVYPLRPDLKGRSLSVLTPHGEIFYSEDPSVRYRMQRNLDDGYYGRMMSAGRHRS